MNENTLYHGQTIAEMVEASIKKTLQKSAEVNIADSSTEAYVNHASSVLSSDNTSLKEAEALMQEILTDPNIGSEIKNLLAFEGRILLSAQLWCLQNFDFLQHHLCLGATLIFEQDDLSGKDLEHRIAALALNKNLGWSTVKSLCTTIFRRENTAMKIRENFFESINDEAFKRLSWLIFSKREELGLGLAILAKKGRAVYDFDENVPDEWVGNFLSMN